MRVIKASTVRGWGKQVPVAVPFLEHWLSVTTDADWENFPAVRATFPHADMVAVASGRSVVIFNVAKTGYRLITAIHYNRGIVYTLLFLKHSEYEKGKWKDHL
jgi:mRNA interferase HigB